MVNVVLVATDLTIKGLIVLSRRGYYRLYSLGIILIVAIGFPEFGTLAHPAIPMTEKIRPEFVS